VRSHFEHGLPTTTLPSKSLRNLYRPYLDALRTLSKIVLGNAIFHTGHLFSLRTSAEDCMLHYYCEKATRHSALPPSGITDLIDSICLCRSSRQTKTRQALRWLFSSACQTFTIMASRLQHTFLAIDFVVTGQICDLRWRKLASNTRRHGT
jgi:hypothetical protein